MSVHIMAMAFVHTMQKVENILRPSGLQLMGQRVSYLQAIPSQEQGAGEDSNWWQCLGHSYLRQMLVGS